MAFLFAIDFLEVSRFGFSCLRPARTRQLKAMLAAYKSRSCNKLLSERRPGAMIVACPSVGELLEIVKGNVEEGKKRCRYVRFQCTTTPRRW